MKCTLSRYTSLQLEACQFLTHVGYITAVRSNGCKILGEISRSRHHRQNGKSQYSSYLFDPHIMLKSGHVGVSWYVCTEFQYIDDVNDFDPGTLM